MTNVSSNNHSAFPNHVTDLVEQTRLLGVVSIALATLAPLLLPVIYYSLDTPAMYLGMPLGMLYIGLSWFRVKRYAGMRRQWAIEERYAAASADGFPDAESTLWMRSAIHKARAMIRIRDVEPRLTIQRSLAPLRARAPAGFMVIIGVLLLFAFLARPIVTVGIFILLGFGVAEYRISALREVHRDHMRLLVDELEHDLKENGRSPDGAPPENGAT